MALEVGSELYGNGIFDASDYFDFSGALAPGPEENNAKGLPEFGILTFDGDFNMERGEFLIDVGGTSESMTD